MFTWNQSYSLGIKEVDDQHKKIFFYLNELFKGNTLKHNKEDLIALIKELKTFAQYHFATEVSYMRKYNYPEMLDHITDHNKLFDDIKKLEEYFNNGITDMAIPVLQFIKKWITNHLADTDKKFYVFMKNNHPEELEMFGV